MTRALHRRYGRGRASAWQRVGDGYEFVVGGPVGNIVYRVQHRKDLDDRQKWDLDQRLYLKPRDGKRREPWVILINGSPFDHAYGKKEAVANVEKRAREDRERAAQARRVSSGPTLGLGLVQTRAQLPPSGPAGFETPGLGREDMRVFAEHLPELRRGRAR